MLALHPRMSVRKSTTEMVCIPPLSRKKPRKQQQVKQASSPPHISAPPAESKPASPAVSFHMQNETTLSKSPSEERGDRHLQAPPPLDRLEPPSYEEGCNLSGSNFTIIDESPQAEVCTPFTSPAQSASAPHSELSEDDRRKVSFPLSSGSNASPDSTAQVKKTDVIDEQLLRLREARGMIGHAMRRLERLRSDHTNAIASATAVNMQA